MQHKIMDSENLKKVLELLQAEKAGEAKVLFGRIAQAENAEYYLLKGKIEQKFQNWGEALNAFSKVLEFEPDNGEAKNRLQIIKGILNFWNPEMFNP